MYGFLISIKYLLGLCIGLSAIRVSKKSYLVTTDNNERGSRTLERYKNKDFEKTVTLLSPPFCVRFQSYQSHFDYVLIEIK